MKGLQETLQNVDQESRGLGGRWSWETRFVTTKSGEHPFQGNS